MSEGQCRLDNLGLVTALGMTPEENWSGLTSGDVSRLSVMGGQIVGEEFSFGAVTGELPSISESLSRFDCRTNRLALAAYQQIRQDVETVVERFGPHRVGVVLGSSTVGVAEIEEHLSRGRQSGVSSNLINGAILEYGVLCDFLQAVSGTTGPSYALSTACSSGAKALASARRLLQLGVCDAVIAGASDSLCRLTANGFHSLQALSKTSLNPMSKNRDGLILGEGAALFLITRESGGIQLAGVGESSDAHHISAPLPDGYGAYQAMRAALHDGGLEPREISYLNLHGTGTLQNDSMESAAVNRLFGDQVPCSSTKPLIGHTLGAAGAIEAGFCWLILKNRDNKELSLLPHVYDAASDPALAPLSLVGAEQKVGIRRQAAVMSNSFGFGGSNCSVLIVEGVS